MPRNRDNYDDGVDDGKRDWADHKRWKEDADYRGGWQDGKNKREADQAQQEKKAYQEEMRMNRSYDRSPTTDSGSVRNIESDVPTPTGKVIGLIYTIGYIGACIYLIYVGDVARLLGLFLIAFPVIGFIIEAIKRISGDPL